MRILLTAFVLIYSLSLFAGDFEAFEGKTLIVNYDKNAMQMYEYVTDEGYIIEDTYTGYYLPLDNHIKIMLKVNKQQHIMSIQQTPDVIRMDPATFEENVSAKLIANINQGYTNLFLEKRDQGELRYYVVHEAAIIDDEPTYLNYFAFPFMIMHLDYGEPFGHAEELYSPVNAYNDGAFTRMYYYGASYEAGHEKYTFFKIYTDACYRRPYGLLADRSPEGEYNPLVQATPMTNNKIVFRTCQHPVMTEYMPGIGIIREYYAETGKTYHSNLVSIDGVPLIDYLKEFDGHVDESILPVVAHHQNNMLTPSSGYGEKGGHDPLVGRSHVNAFDKLIRHNDDNEPGVVKKPANASAKPAYIAPNQTRNNAEGGKIHLVQQGDTLYNISRRYNTTVEKIQQANGGLPNYLIIINQELVIPQ